MATSSSLLGLEPSIVYSLAGEGLEEETRVAEEVLGELFITLLAIPTVRVPIRLSLVRAVPQ